MKPVIALKIRPIKISFHIHLTFRTNGLGLSLGIESGLSSTDSNTQIDAVYTQTSIVMGRPRDEIDLYVKIGNHLIKRVKSTKILGIIIDQSLHFEEHINDICEKANIRLNVMSRLRYSVPKSTVKLVFDTMVFPIIKYCSPVFDYTYVKHTNRLGILIRTAARITIFSRFDTNHIPLFQELKWKSFAETMSEESVK